MKLIGYKQPSKEFWHGRCDDEYDYNSFRWHQIIKLLDLSGDIGDLNNSYVIIGYEVDEGIVRNKGRKGAAKAPNFIKQSLSNKPCSFDEDISIYDGGSIECVGLDVETSQDMLAVVVNKVLQAGGFPIVLGGGHDVAYGSMKAIANYVSKTSSLGIINFDAHLDNRPYSMSTSGTMFRQIKDDFEREGRDYNHLTIGVQKSSNTTALFNDMKEANGEYILARDIRPTNSYHNNEVINKFVKTNEYVYITICCDVFSSAFAPGVSSPQPLGIHPEDFMEFFKTIILSGKVVCLDIAEVSPELDISDTTVSLVALIVYTLVNFKCENNL